MKHLEVSEPVSILTASAVMQDLLDAASRTAALDRPVLVIGERGTGKELIAARLHYLSPRWDRPYIRLNCAAVTETLLESELFGHEAGAFTGATRRHIGRFEQADGGTLFLDELATMSQRLQEKILRVVEYGEFERVGGRETLHVDVRIIGATNVDLPDLAQRGEFRADLLDRLSFCVLTVPPVRARGADSLLLAEHFATAMARELELEFFPGFSQPVCDRLLAYDWPGNVREIKSVAERAMFYWGDQPKPITEIDLDPFASPYRPTPTQAGQSARTQLTQTDKAVPRHQLPLNLKDAVRELEIELLRLALRRNQYHQANSARDLGLSYHQLRAYLRKYGEALTPQTE